MRHNFYVCRFCVKPIYRGGVEVSPKTGNGYARETFAAHKSCLRAATGNHNLVSNLFRLLKKTGDFIKADLVKNQLS